MPQTSAAAAVAVPQSARAAVVGRLTAQMQQLQQQFQEVQQMMGQLHQPG
jgi:prefoldin subunit 5